MRMMTNNMDDSWDGDIHENENNDTSYFQIRNSVENNRYYEKTINIKQAIKKKKEYWFLFLKKVVAIHSQQSWVHNNLNALLI